MEPLPWYRSQVYVSAVVALISQILVLLGKQSVVPIEQLTITVEALFQVIALVATAWAAYKRQTSDVQPLTFKTGQVNKNAGRVSLMFLLIVALVSSVLVACSHTKAAYKEASNPEEYAYVILEHYYSLVNEAANLRESPSTSAASIQVMQRAEKAVAPYIDVIPKLRDAYAASKNTQDQIALQRAVDRAVLAIADLIRAVKEARASRNTWLEFNEPELVV